MAVGGLEVGLSVLGSGGEADTDVIRGGLRWRGLDTAWHEATHAAAQPACGFVGMRECLIAFIQSVRAGLPPTANIEVARRVHAAMLACAQAEAARLLA